MIALLAACASGPSLEIVEEPADHPEQTLPLVVMVHGYGGRPDTMAKLVRDCGLPVRIVAPRGPLDHPSGEGWAWYPVSFTKDGVDRDASAVKAAEEQLAELIRQLRSDRNTTKVVVSGFSQGAILSFAVATAHPDLVDAAVPVSGAIPTELMPAGPPPARSPVIRALHGEADPVLPLAPTRDRVDQLRALGWDATIETFPGVAHQITAEVDRAFCRDLSDAIR